jgi:hypothetical protein
VLEQILQPGYFDRTGIEVLCFGVDWASTAMTAYLLTHSNSKDRPRRVVTDLDTVRQTRLEALHGLLASGVLIKCVRTDEPLVSDRLATSLTNRSLDTNAIVMGKDRTGAPASEAVRFPRDGTAWMQQRDRRLRVEDGWASFVFGWTTVLEAAFTHPITWDELAQFSPEGKFTRPPLPTSKRTDEPEVESP